MKTIAHVNQHVLTFNRKYGTAIPALTVKQGARTRYCQELKFDGSGSLIDSAAQGIPPLHCGARIWMEFQCPVELICEISFQDVQRQMAMTKEYSTKSQVERECAVMV